MAKHKRIWNQCVHEKYLREGRGCGWGTDYSPWIHVQDFSSRGVISRVKGRTTGRVHHLLSNNELAYFYILDWSESVTDIREQYPLSDLKRAVKIAAHAGIKYPTDIVSGYPYVMTCDFMITTKDGHKARTVKQSSELSNPRVLEKLEIERRYWLEQGIDWKIVTENEISYRKAKNIEWLYTAQDFVITDELLPATDMMRTMLKSDNLTVVQIAEAVENEFLLNPGMGLLLFKLLALDGVVSINLNEPINVCQKGLSVAV